MRQAAIEVVTVAWTEHLALAADRDFDLAANDHSGLLAFVRHHGCSFIAAEGHHLSLIVEQVKEEALVERLRTELHDYFSDACLQLDRLADLSHRVAAVAAPFSTSLPLIRFLQPSSQQMLTVFELVVHQQAGCTDTHKVTDKALVRNHENELVDYCRCGRCRLSGNSIEFRPT